MKPGHVENLFKSNERREAQAKKDAAERMQLVASHFSGGAKKVFLNLRPIEERVEKAIAQLPQKPLLKRAKRQRPARVAGRRRLARRGRAGCAHSVNGRKAHRHNGKVHV